MSRRSTGRKGSTESNEFPPLHLVYVDQAPLRDRVAGECSEAMLRLEEARAGWHHFERKDKPAFTRWRAREFGALLSRSREVEIQIRDSQALIHEVEMEMRRGFQDAHRAYQRVMFRRANPSADPVEEQSEGENRGAARKLSDFEKEALFQEWVKRSLGTNPDKMDDEAYSASFEAFKSHMSPGGGAASAKSGPPARPGTAQPTGRTRARAGVSGGNGCTGKGALPPAR